MTDRVADIWGTRTPFGAGSRWPVRVDQYLDEGTPEDEVEWHQSACVLCSNGCGMDVAVYAGRIVGVRGRAADRVNRGRLGPKGLFGWQAGNSADRLTRPLVRREGELRPAGWDEAMAVVVDRTREVMDERGPLGMGFYNSGQLFLEDYYTLSVLVRAGIGSPHLDGNTRLCTATADFALKETFGTDGAPGTMGDFDECDTLFASIHRWCIEVDLSVFSGGRLSCRPPAGRGDRLVCPAFPRVRFRSGPGGRWITAGQRLSGGAWRVVNNCRQASAQGQLRGRCSCRRRAERASRAGTLTR